MAEEDLDGVDEGPAFVAGELRCYRQFDLRDDGLYPRVHDQTGPWREPIERARCVVVPGHEPPVAGCTCGLYAWYLPGSATVALGPASAVVAASGRCRLGDRGFRAEAARIEAVTLPGHLWWNPWALARVRRMLATRYPGARVYATARRMIRDHPPQDVSALGIDPPADRSRGYRAAVLLLSAAVMVPIYSLFFVPRDAIAPTLAAWWPAFLVAVVLWQAGIVWLLGRLLALQTDGPRDTWWIQAVVATPGGLDPPDNSSSRASAGVRQPSVFRGRLLSSAAIWSSIPGP
jgi:hypothetical protein